MVNYVSTLRSMTRGRGQYTMQASRGGGVMTPGRRTPAVSCGGVGAAGGRGGGGHSTDPPPPDRKPSMPSRTPAPAAGELRGRAAAYPGGDCVELLQEGQGGSRLSAACHDCEIVLGMAQCASKNRSPAGSVNGSTGAGRANMHGVDGREGAGAAGPGEATPPGAPDCHVRNACGLVTPLSFSQHKPAQSHGGIAI